MTKFTWNKNLLANANIELVWVMIHTPDAEYRANVTRDVHESKIGYY